MCDLSVTAVAAKKFLKHIRRTPISLNQNKGLKRQHETFAAKERIGHIVTESYLHRFKISDRPLCKS